jgi:hypothetical protein
MLLLQLVISSLLPLQALSMNHSATMESFRSQCRGDSPPPSYPATILSYDDVRFKSAVSVLEPLGFNIRRQVPIPSNSSLLVERYLSYPLFKGRTKPDWGPRGAMAFSNKMAFEDAIRDFVNGSSTGPTAGQDAGAAPDPNEWGFFFEDDIAIHPRVENPLCDVLAGTLMAASDGIFYLGICPTSCSSFSTTTPPELGRTFKRCAGNCAHAFAMTRWKAKMIMDMEIFHNLQKKYSSHRSNHYFDRALFFYGYRMSPVLVLDSNLIHYELSHDKKTNVTAFIGMMIQDRHKFKSDFKW